MFRQHSQFQAITFLIGKTFKYRIHKYKLLCCIYFYFIFIFFPPRILANNQSNSIYEQEEGHRQSALNWPCSKDIVSHPFALGQDLLHFALFPTWATSVAAQGDTMNSDWLYQGGTNQKQQLQICRNRPDWCITVIPRKSKWGHDHITRSCINAFYLIFQTCFTLKVILLKFMIFFLDNVQQPPCKLSP